MSADRKMSRRGFLQVLGGAALGYAASELTKPQVAGLGNTVKPVLIETVDPAKDEKKKLEDGLKVAGQMLHEENLDKIRAMSFTLAFGGKELIVDKGKVDSKTIESKTPGDLPLVSVLLAREEPVPGTELVYSFAVVNMPPNKSSDRMDWIAFVSVSKPNTDRQIVFSWQPFSEMVEFNGIGMNTRYGFNPDSGDDRKFPLFVKAFSNDDKVDQNAVGTGVWGWDNNRLAIDSLVPVAKEWGGIINSDDRFWDKVEIHPDNQKSRAELIEDFVTKNGSIIAYVLASQF
jgi:hypothetical protein